MSDNRPFFSIITPTIMRSTLKRTCQSIDAQTFQDWEHIVIADLQHAELPEELKSPKRRFTVMGRKGGAYGNYARNKAADFVTGTYVTYIDDDDYYEPDALERVMETALQHHKPNWIVAPMELHKRYYRGEVRQGHIGTCQMFHLAGIMSWPAVDNYDADWTLASSLSKMYGDPVFVPGNRIAVVEKHNRARML